ncbi:MAG: N-acetyltransferase [Chlorobi bacterium]|nr:N-acetyltransferase [Chlorobiota bacterium]
MSIRKETPNDITTIHQINSTAFETDAEADLVDKLRDSGVTIISLVAEVDDKLVGYILFTPMTMDNFDIKIAGLAPMAVLPDYQNKGIGSTLIEKGLEYCAKENYAAVAVLGHPNYYPKFGFVPSTRFDLISEYDVPKEVFMIKELKRDSLSRISGIVKYHEEFSKL